MAVEPNVSSKRAVVERAQAAAQGVKAAGDRIEAARELPPDVHAALVETGMCRLTLPRSIG
ncbi:MAG: acyl-CoA dehydrogenase, partial [Hyphomicrobiaceae bacterium]